MKTSRERLTVGRRGETDLTLRHKSVYDLCGKFALGKRVLDLGCGDGYGSFLLAQRAKEVVGIDIDRLTIENAKKKYKFKNLSFYTQDISSLSAVKLFDLVVSLQVIEHIDDDHGFLSQIKKVLKKNGTLILTTPNRKLRLNDGQKPWNPFHVREYDQKQFERLLSDYFKEVKIWGLSASGSTYDTEIKRLRIRKTISRFDPLGLYNLIPERWTTLAFGLIKKIIIPNSNNRKGELSVKDFFITKKEVNKAFDLIALCRN